MVSLQRESYSPFALTLQKDGIFRLADFRYQKTKEWTADYADLTPDHLLFSP